MNLAPDAMRARVLAYWLREELHFSPKTAVEVIVLLDKALEIAKKDPFTIRLVQLVRAQAVRARELTAQLSLSDHTARQMLDGTRIVSLLSAGGNS